MISNGKIRSRDVNPVKAMMSSAFRSDFMSLQMDHFLELASFFHHCALGRQLFATEPPSVIHFQLHHQDISISLFRRNGIVSFLYSLYPGCSGELKKNPGVLTSVLSWYSEFENEFKDVGSSSFS
jgi:hypothetical protein